jgi:glutamine amidotransferase
MIAILDITGHNLTSLGNAFQRLNVPFEMTHDKALIEKASHIILPGVGTAPHAMAALKANGLVEVLQQATQPILGICLGMQLLLESSEEGDVACLGLIPGRAAHLLSKPDMPIPHMGWNRLHWQYNSPLMNGIQEGEPVYFVHSYALKTAEFALARTEYSEPFTAMVQRGNVYGMQFHPEKSGKTGLQLLKNFSELSC